MKNKILKTCEIVLTVICLIVLVMFNSWSYSIRNIAIGMAVAIGIVIIYSIILSAKVSKYLFEKRKKNSAIFMILFIIIKCIEMFFIEKNLIIQYGIFSLLEACNIFMTYYILRKKYDKNKALLSMIISIILNSFIMVNSIVILTSCILLFYTLILRIKKNDNGLKKGITIVSLLIIMTCIICMYGNFLILIPLLIVAREYKNLNKKIIILFLSLLVILCILSLVIPIGFNMVNQLNYSEITMSMYLLFIFVALLYINKHSNSVSNCFLLISILISSLDWKLFYLTTTIMAYYIIINYYVINEINLLKYIRTRQIKKVSVVIPNYNYARFIEKRIDSVLKQNYPIYELIILDDKSTDNSDEIIRNKIETIKNKGIIIKYIPNEKNSGNVFKQWEKAFKLSTGDYLWIAEADDSVSKYFLNSVMRKFKKDDIIISYSESKTINNKGQVCKDNIRDWIDMCETGHWESSYIIDGKEEIKQYSAVNNTIGNVSSVVFNKKINCDFSKYIKEAQNFKLAGDWYFYSKILQCGKIAYTKNALNYFRIHDGSVSATTNNLKHYSEILKIQDTINNDLILPIKTKENIEKRRETLRYTLTVNDDELKYSEVNLDDLINKKAIRDETLLTIIIPVYNTEKYLRKCLDSFIENLPIKTEVLIINDGSTDRSEDIIKEFEKKYKQIRYIKKENGGLSSVKNLGLKEAKGRYIIFLDSDDYVEKGMYNIMLKKAIDEEADMVFCDVFEAYENGQKKYFKMINEYEEDIRRYLDTSLMAASWNKMVKKELYDDIEFPPNNNEDVAVSPVLFIKSKNTCYITCPLYNYLQRERKYTKSAV